MSEIRRELNDQGYVASCWWKYVLVKQAALESPTANRLLEGCPLVRQRLDCDGIKSERAEATTSTIVPSLRG